MTERIRINTGRRIRDKKIVYSFKDFASGEDFDLTAFGWTSAKNQFPNNTIGAVWSFTETDDGNVWIRGENAPEFMYHLEDEIMLEWTTLDKGAAISIVNIRASSNPPEWQKTIDTQLAPIRAILADARDYRIRAAIIGYIIDQVH